MIVCTISGRVGYVKLLAETLKWLEVEKYSTLSLFVDNTDQLSLAEVQQLFPRAQVYKVQHEFSPLSSPDMSTRVAFEHFYRSHCNIMVNIDSDTALHPDWHKFIVDNLGYSQGVLSLYNSAAHGATWCGKGVCSKQTVGAMGVVMTRATVGKILENVPRRLGGFDWGFVDYFKSQGVEILVPEKSLALHYGMHGSNGNGTHIEHAIGFDESVFPKEMLGRIQLYLDGMAP